MTERDWLEEHALDIATQHLLNGRTLRDLEGQYSASASTLHRRLAEWRRQGRFELVDTRRSAARVSGRHERLEEELSRHTRVWRARVVRVEGASSAFADGYLSDPSTPTAVQAFHGGDELHRALGTAASEVFVNSWRRHSNVGLASGRGVGFTITAIEELGERRPSLFRGYDSMRLEALCGGGHVGPWITPVGRDLDADQNVFALANLLGVGKANVSFMGGWIASGNAHQGMRSSSGLDVALVGFGQLNTRHHFLHHYQEVQLGDMAAPLAKIRSLQSRDERLLFSVAEIAHRLFVVGPGPHPPGLADAIAEVNAVASAVSPERLRAAGEIVLVAGGAQKVRGLAELLAGRCPDAPIDPRSTTLVTDDRTAAAILEIVRK